MNKTIEEILCFHYDAKSFESLQAAMVADRIDEVFLLGLIIRELTDRRDNMIKEKKDKESIK